MEEEEERRTKLAREVEVKKEEEEEEEEHEAVGVGDQGPGQDARPRPLGLGAMAAGMAPDQANASQSDEGSRGVTRLVAVAERAAAQGDAARCGDSRIPDTGSAGGRRDAVLGGMAGYLFSLCVSVPLSLSLSLSLPFSVFVVRPSCIFP
ncbi:hypothetical protein Ct61P_13276 [Colletotrichum tofieldiae]|nr:hypothetical protein Ct61P_13276 [Colletotrichum tofieldiae]